MSVSAMKCALQSLESVEKVKGWNKNSIVGRHCTQSAHFLRQAIEQAEDAVAAEREACAQLLENGRFLHDEAPAAILAKEAAKAIRARGDASDISQERVDETAKDRHEWVEQPDLARVGEVGVWGHQREWVGLTEDEVMNIWYQNGFECMIYAKAVEAKLKEKNT